MWVMIMTIVNLSLNLKVKTIYVPVDFYNSMVDSDDDRVFCDGGKVLFNGVNIEVSSSNDFDVDIEPTVIDTKRKYAPERDIDTVEIRVSEIKPPRGMFTRKAQI